METKHNKEKPMTKEDRSHRSHQLNPRRHPTGADYPDRSASKLSKQLKHVALLSPSEMRFIQDIPRLLGNGDYANLGHSRGGSAILMADSLIEHSLKGRIYSVDLFPTSKQKQDAIYQVSKFRVGSRIELCEGSTDQWAKDLAQHQFNFVFIDADHTYDAVVADFTNWSELIKPGGWVAFHDTNQDFSHQAVEATVADCWPELKKYHIDRIRTFKRPS